MSILVFALQLFEGQKGEKLVFQVFSYSVWVCSQLCYNSVPTVIWAKSAFSQQCGEVEMTAHRWCTSIKKKDRIIGSLFPACCGIPVLMKYIAGLQKSYLRIFYPPPPLGLLFSFIFPYFSVGKLKTIFPENWVFQISTFKELYFRKECRYRAHLRLIWKVILCIFTAWSSLNTDNMVPYYRDVHI